MRVVKIVLSLSMLALVFACSATGPLYAEISSAIPSVPPNKGRIYFFRGDGTFGGTPISDIVLNGKVVGKSERGSFFYIDENPGNCTVATSNGTERQLTFVLERGRTVYVQTSVSFGVLVGRVTSQLVSPDVARKEIVNLHYTGAPLSGK